jgi:hypothetical protein
MRMNREVNEAQSHGRPKRPHRDLMTALIAIACALIGVWGQGPGRIVASIAAVVLAVFVAMHYLGARFRLRPWFAHVVLIGVLAYVAIPKYMAYLGQPEPARLTTEQLQHRAVEDSNNAEFRAYSDLPMVQIAWLRGRFIEHGPAFRRIRHLLEVHAERGWRLHPDSSRKLIACEVLGPNNRDGTSVMVRTRESWNLKWIDGKTGAITKTYVKTTDQTYELWLVGRDWLVYANDYPVVASR